jgi:hypothetical protein
MTKYKITANDIMRQGGIAKLERDGFKRETIMKEMYKHTSGASTQQREQIVSRLYDREKPC